jgi:putative addiction module component (TIGR02574 family)
MDSRQIVDAFRRLPSDEQARLVEMLWDEFEGELERQPVSEAHRRLIDERLQRHQENPTDVEAWEVARDEILRDL